MLRFIKPGNLIFLFYSLSGIMGAKEADFFRNNPGPTFVETVIKTSVAT